MTKISIQTVIHECVDPVLEAMISGLVESASRPKTFTQTKGAGTMALALALVGALMTPPSPRQPKPRVAIMPLETVLASALATALAPAIAQSLTPTIIQTLSTMASTEKPSQERTDQESASSEVSDQQEHHQ